jgi:hypothetical protein
MLGKYLRAPLSVAAVLSIAVSAAVPLVDAVTGASPAGATAGPIVYSSIPNTLPANVPSEGFQASQTAELGDEVGLTQTGYLQSANVGLSSWACQSGAWNTHDCSSAPGATFPVTMTFSVYAVVPGSPPSVDHAHPLETKTQTFNVPYRPSQSGICTGPLAGEWFNGADSNCYNGYLNTIQFDMSNATGPGVGQPLPSQVVWGVAFNTTTWGYAPIGTQACDSAPQGCAYDSLNVGLESAANTGTDVDPNGVFQNAALGSDYCNGMNPNAFRDDTPCWTGYVPMASLQLYPTTAPVISGQAVTVPEGNTTHDVTVPVTLDHPYSHTVTVQWRTAAQTAKAGSDFTTNSGTLMFAPGQTTPSTPLTVSVVGDPTVEPNEHFQVDLTNPSNASLVGNPKTLKYTVTLLNDDLPAMRANTVSVTEGSAATVTYTISQVYYQPITINLALHDGTAVAPGDYGPLPGPSITIPAQSKTATVVIPTNIDGVTEKSEFFTISGTSIEPTVTNGKVIIKSNNT